MHRRVLPYLLVALVSSLLTALLQPWAYIQGIAEAQSGCRTFTETGNTVCGKFLTYWQRNGQIAQQGYPLSNEFVAVSDLDNKPYTVQYFERAVFEYHPENKKPHDVLLSHLGKFRWDDKYGKEQ